MCIRDRRPRWSPREAPPRTPCRSRALARQRPLALRRAASAQRPPSVSVHRDPLLGQALQGLIE
eukprot:2318649-Alexandrium_andersonii.AAC.1